jgi:hypothetical protein
MSENNTPLGVYGIDEERLYSVRDIDGHLVGKVCEETGAFVVSQKDCTTIVLREPEGNVRSISFKTEKRKTGKRK